MKTYIYTLTGLLCVSLIINWIFFAQSYQGTQSYYKQQPQVVKDQFSVVVNPVKLSRDGLTIENTKLINLQDNEKVLASKDLTKEKDLTKGENLTEAQNLANTPLTISFMGEIYISCKAAGYKVNEGVIEIGHN